MDNSELIVNKDGSICHLHTRPEDLADTILLVGDQGRVEMISKHFDRIELKISNREFITHTGHIGHKRITVMSTGIGTDNIDIVLNELDATVNMDLNARTFKQDRKSLNLIRLGTTGALHKDIPVGALVLSEFGLGLDGLIHHYNYRPSTGEFNLQQAIIEHLNWDSKLPEPYIVGSNQELLSQFQDQTIKGITATASGFYGPQGRSIYLSPRYPEIEEMLQTFHMDGHRITNFEMETSALYGLAKLLGHRACTCCVVLANRLTGDYASDHRKAVEKMIRYVLERIAQ